MQMDLTQKLSLILCCAFFSGHVCAAQETNRYNPNPASIGYVDAAIEAAFKNSIYTAGTAISIVNNVISGAYTAGPGVSISGSTISGNYTGASGITVNNSTGTISSTPVELGSCMYGGVVFYVDPTGQHGLVAQLSQGNVAQFISDDFNIAATSNGVGAGLLNTAAWMGMNDLNLQFATALLNTTSYAVLSDGVTFCGTPLNGAPTFTPANGECYSEWYVPSIYEMQLLYQNQAYLTSGPGCSGGPADPLASGSGGTCENAGDVCYWTSNAPTDISTNIYVINSATGPIYNIDRNTNYFYYRAIRQF